MDRAPSVLVAVSRARDSGPIVGVNGSSSGRGRCSLCSEERGVFVGDLDSVEEAVGRRSIVSGDSRDPGGDSFGGGALVLGAVVCSWVEESTVEASKLGRELCPGEPEPSSALTRGSVAEKLDLCDVLLAATALANLSCNLSFADLEGVVDRGGGVGVGATAEE